MSKLTSFKDFARGALTKIKSSWSKHPGDEVRIPIPAIGSDNLIKEARSGELEAIKGNYNEALLLQMIYETKSDVIQIDKKYQKNKSAIDQKVKQWDDALKNAKNGNKAKPIIEQGTKAMLQYLIQTTKQADSIIIGGYLDNLSFQRGGIATKGDIGLHVMKEGKEELQDFSLKLYGTKSVGLANTSAGGLAGHLVGPKGKSEVDKTIEKDEELQVLMKAANSLDRTKNALKDYNSSNEKKQQSGLSRLKKYGFTERQIKKLNIDKLRDERQIARTDINPRLAQISFDVITKFQKSNPKKFNENLLDILGFNDHDTKMLMAVTTKRGSVIIDRHPELDLNNIKLVKTGVSIKVVGPTNKTVVTFGFKEGEKKAVTGKVSYASVPIFNAESMTYEKWNEILDICESDLIIENLLNESKAADLAKKKGLTHLGRGNYGKDGVAMFKAVDDGNKLVKLDKPEIDKTDAETSNVVKATKEHIKEISKDFKDVGLGNKHIIQGLRDKNVYNILKGVGFNTTKLGSIAVKSAKTIKVGLEGVSKDILKTDLGKKIQNGTAKVDEVLNKYPSLKKITGVAVAGFALYQWYNMSFSGDIESDYDLSLVSEAMAGNYSIQDILASPSGMTGLGLLAAGIATGGLPIWIGGAKGIPMALAYGGLKSKYGDKMKDKLSKLKEKVQDSVDIKRESYKIPSSFKTLSEASTPGKNVHMTHIEDRVLYGGVKGAREAIFALRGMRDMLAGQSSKTTDVTVKWDGAPAVFAGIDPRDGQFFVAKKGIFNKDPKVYKSHKDIDADTSGDLNNKLKIAYDELKKLGIKNVVQGDLLFTDDVETESIQGEKYFTFQPNTIVYAVPVNSPLGKRISKSKIGIIFHTTYTGKDILNH